MEEGKHLFGLSLFRPSRQSNIHTTLPRRAKKHSNIPSPGRTRSVKYPTPGPTKTIKSPPHALPPHRPRRLYIDRCISLLTGSQIVGMKGTGNAGTWNRLIQFPAHGQIIPVKCNQISPPRPRATHCCQISQGWTKERHNKISPNKTLQSLFLVFSKLVSGRNPPNPAI